MLLHLEDLRREEARGSTPVKHVVLVIGVHSETEIHDDWDFAFGVPKHNIL